MKELLLKLTDKQFKELNKYPNKSQAIRNAIDIYNEHISTDTIQGLQKSYSQLTKYMQTKFEYYDEAFARMDKLISVLETRM